MRNLLKASLLVTVMMWASATPASAVTLTLNTLFSGAQPVGDVTVTITDAGANTVQLVFALPGVYTGSGQFITEWDLNLSPFVSPTFTHVSGATATVTSGLDFEKADGDGFYDIFFDFPSGPPASRLGDGGSLTSTYTATGTGLDSTDFFALSQNGGPTGAFYSAAHVQGLANNCSGWIGAPGQGQTDITPDCGVVTTTTPTSTTTTPSTTTTTSGISPEPTMLTLLGSGLVFAARRMRRSRKTA